MALVRKFHRKGVSDASVRALQWYLRNQLLFQQGLENHPRVLIVRYGRIVTEPSDSFRKIFSFFDIPFRVNFVSHVRTSSIGKDPPPVLDPEIRSLCDDMFARLSAVAAI